MANYALMEVPMHRRKAISTLVAGALLAPPLRASAQSIVDTFKVIMVPTEDAAAVYHAIRTGMFRKAGLDIEFVPASSGGAATTAVIGGTYEMAKPALIGTFSAFLRDVPIQIVGPGFIHTPEHPNALLQIAPDSNFRTGADLNGKTMAVQTLNDVGSLACRAWVDKNGGDWRSLKYLELPNSAVEDAIARHRVDVGSMTAPALDISLAAGTTKTLGDGFGAIAPIVMLGGYIARREWVATHTDTLRRFNRVLSEVVGYFNTHLPETAPLVAELTKIEIANVSKMNRTVSGTTLDPKLIQPLIDAAVKYEVIPRSFKASEILWNAGRR